MKPKFKRQMVLIESINEAQLKCQHTIEIGRDFILCTECGALWIKVESNGKQQAE